MASLSLKNIKKVYPFNGDDAKKAKNFAEADRIRDELKAQGIEVTDIPNGAKWKRI